MVLPDSATSNFTIKLAGDDTLYVADVAKKEDAKETYDDAVQKGQSVGLVNKDTRDANRLSVSVNLEPAGKLTFTLTYEELLKRVNSKYEYILHVQPGQIVKDYQADIYLNESLPLRSIHVPELKTNRNEITSELKPSSIANVERNIDGDSNRAHIVFKPDVQYQQLAAKNLEKDESDGMFGQFIVQYDVDLSSTGGNEIQVLDGYFVHYFAPENLQTLPRHIIFVVDVSGSMSGTKLKQTKDAMVTILDDMTEQDYFDIITFSTDVKFWSNKPKAIPTTPSTIRSTQEPTTSTINTNGTTTFLPNIQVQQIAQQKPQVKQQPRVPLGIDSIYEPDSPGVEQLVHAATEDNKNEALLEVLGFEASGSTNINDALLGALTLVEKVRKAEKLPENVRPTIVFLTDGEPTVGVTASSEIKKNVNAKNKELGVPIFGLAFGVDPDFALVKDIAVESGAFARRIYETSDAAIQLEDFHSRISSPLLYDVVFKYVGGSFSDQTSLNVSKTFYKGGEYVIAGKINDDFEQEDETNRPRIIIDASQYLPTKYVQEIWPCYLKSETNVEDETDTPLHNNTLVIKRPSLCIPVKPKVVKTDAENFIERLWAFLTIQNLLEESNEKEENFDDIYSMPPLTTSSTIINDDESEKMNETIPEKEKSKKERAIEIALKYNFVTDVTSLVVKKPNENHKNSTELLEPVNDTQDEESIDSTSLLKSNSQYSTSYVNQKQVNYGYSQKTFIPKGGSFGAPTHFNRRFQSFGSGGGSHFALSAPNYASSFQLSGPPAPPVPRRRPSLRATTTRATTTSRYLSTTTDIYGALHQFDSSIDQFDYDADGIPDDIDPDNEEEVVTEKPKDPAFLDCKISIYSKTYNRGDSFTLETENSDKNQTLEIKDLNKA